jgi:hypothetical protein
MADRVRNWAALTEAHKKRGSLVINFVTVCEAQAAQLPTRSNKRGRPRKYSLDLITTLLTLKVLLRLPLRAIQGLAEEAFAKAGLVLDCPDYTLLSRRASEVEVTLPRLSAGEALWVVADGTGLKLYGEGEWHTKVHGASKHRRWCKVTLLTDPLTGIIHSAVSSSSAEAEITHLPALLEPHDLQGCKLAYDGAADTHNAYETARAKGCLLVTPPREGARRWRKEPAHHPRNRAVRAIGFIGKKAWKRRSGYHCRSLAETANHRLKCITGSHLAFRTEANQQVEVRLRVQLLNQLVQQRGSFA